MSKARTITLTIGEAKVTDGHLCWRPQFNGPIWYGRACSREFGHPDPITGCRYDMRIKAPTWTPQRVRIAVASGVFGASASALLSWLVTR